MLSHVRGRSPHVWPCAAGRIAGSILPRHGARRRGARGQARGPRASRSRRVGMLHAFRLREFALKASGRMSAWKPPRRNGHVVRIGADHMSLAYWSRRAGISHNNLLMVKKRQGVAAMVRRIKLGMRGGYVAK